MSILALVHFTLHPARTIFTLTLLIQCRCCLDAINPPGVSIKARGDEGGGAINPSSTAAVVVPPLPLNTGTHYQRMFEPDYR